MFNISSLEQAIEAGETACEFSRIVPPGAGLGAEIELGQTQVSVDEMQRTLISTIKYSSS